MIDQETGEIIVPFIRTPYNYDTNKASAEGALFCDPNNPEDNYTQQSFKEECDINTIVRRFGLTGQLPDNVRVPQYGDFTGVTDYQSALNAVMQADAQFMELPAKLREQFNNDPQELLAFMEDPNNLDKARELGLVNKPPEKTRDAVQAIDELRTALTPAPK